ncbi:hypothetical protein [Ornithinimicrobium kibberense]|uniref:hypothetical protein n=1 Tax=Ornithinimicrobium kibberense TaxID=282060 RepID=UPI00360893B0
MSPPARRAGCRDRLGPWSRRRGGRYDEGRHTCPLRCPGGGPPGISSSSRARRSAAR